MIVHYTFHIHPDHKERAKEELRKLRAEKDEYGCGRRYTESEFAGAIAGEFESDDLQIEFYIAPPALVKPSDWAQPSSRSMVSGSKVSACHISSSLMAVLGMKLQPTSQG